MAPEGDLEEKFRGDVEAAAETFDVGLVEVALAAETFGDDAGRASIIGARNLNAETQRTQKKKEKRKGRP
jgi:hypothetical protein